MDNKPIGPMLIELQAQTDNDDWITVARQRIDTPQKGNPFKSMMKHAVRPVRVVQEVTNE